MEVGRNGGLTMGLLKAVCLDSMLARLASARLPVRRCVLVLWIDLPGLPKGGTCRNLDARDFVGGGIGPKVAEGALIARSPRGGAEASGY